MSHHVLKDIALAYYEALDTAHSLSCAILTKENEWDQLVTRTTEPLQFLTAYDYHKTVCANDFLRKLDSAPTSFDRTTVSFTKWLAAEKQCFRTNRTIWNILDGLNSSTDMLEFFSSVRKNIHSLILRPPENLDYRFGPGATYLHRGVHCLIPDKISQVPEMTENAWIFLRDWADSAWARALADQLYQKEARLSLEFPCIRGNRWASVPKDGKTNRAIAIEPTLNSYIQLGIGGAMRKALNRYGLLLDNSQEIHRKLARKGSLDDSLATIDLSNASDTVAYALVKAVLPDSWFRLLDAARSPKTQLPTGQWVHLEKFSSMGNGYTFELETTIFASICLAVADQCNVTLVPGENFSVFGDDIIVPTTIAGAVIDALIATGFQLNLEKTFTAGPFRESCGGDFYNGANVRGVFQKADPSTPGEWFALYNKVNKLSDLADMTSVLQLIRQQIPLAFRHLGGPSHLGDIVLHDIPSVVKRRFDIKYCKTLQTQTDSFTLRRWDERTAVASMLYGQLSSKVTPRNSISGYRTAWVAIP